MRATKKDKIVAKTPEAASVLADLSELARSYVAGGIPMWAPMFRSLSQELETIDSKTLRRMMTDPFVRSSVNTLRMRAVENDWTFAPSMDPPTRAKETQASLAKYKKSCDVADFVTRAHQDIEWPLEDVTYDMLRCLVYGHAAAEQVLRNELFGDDKGKLVMDALEVKPRENYAFVLDYSNRAAGVVAAIPGISLSVPTGVGINYPDLPNFMPMEKWWVLTYGGEGMDPRGETILQTVNKAYAGKMQTFPNLIRYIVQFGGPALIGYTPEDKPNSGAGTQAQTRRGTSSGLSPEAVMFKALEMFQAGSIVVLRGGSKIDTIQSQGEGKAHLNAIDMFNREIVQGILLQIRATMEAAHGSRADSDSATDIMDVSVRWIQKVVQRSYRRQVVRRLVSYNYGIEIAREFTPRALLTQVGHPDFVDEGNTVANLQTSGYLHVSQYPGIDQRLGLPERDMNAVMEEIKQNSDNERMNAKQKQRIADPAADTDDDELDDAA